MKNRVEGDGWLALFIFARPGSIKEPGNVREEYVCVCCYVLRGIISLFWFKGVCDVCCVSRKSKIKADKNVFVICAGGRGNDFRYLCGDI